MLNAELLSRSRRLDGGSRTRLLSQRRWPHIGVRIPAEQLYAARLNIHGAVFNRHRISRLPGRGKRY